MNQNVQVITTVEIAEMMGISHKNILRKIEGNERIKGILSVLTERNFAPSEFFVESKYKDASGKENKCYNCTAPVWVVNFWLTNSKVSVELNLPPDTSNAFTIWNRSSGRHPYQLHHPAYSRK